MCFDVFSFSNGILIGIHFFVSLSKYPFPSPNIYLGLHVVGLLRANNTYLTTNTLHIINSYRFTANFTLVFVEIVCSLYRPDWTGRSEDEELNNNDNNQDDINEIMTIMLLTKMH